MVVVIVNHPPDAPDSCRRANELLLHRLDAGELRLPRLVWRFAPELTGGVGAARKLGMDAVIASLTPESVEEAAIWSLDADTTVEPGYLEESEAFLVQSKAGAVTIGFRHREGNTPELERAIRRYEEYLDSYVERLRRAGSPYAFHTVGSAFVCRAASYIRCGGMRVRTGGEDFYFLQAVAKTAKVAELQKVLIHPSPRPSERVPFGTGPSVRKLLRGEPLPEISDGAFARLKQLLDAAASPGALDRADALLRRLPAASAAFLEAERFPAAWNGVLANLPKTPGAQQEAFHCWFDGLRTLRFLHAAERDASGN